VRDGRIVRALVFGIVVPDEVEFLAPGGVEVGGDDLFGGGGGEVPEGAVGYHDPFVGWRVGGRNPVSVGVAPDLDPFFQVVVEGLGISVFEVFPHPDDGVADGVFLWNYRCAGFEVVGVLPKRGLRVDGMQGDGTGKRED